MDVVLFLSIHHKSFNLQILSLINSGLGAKKWADMSPHHKKYTIYYHGFKDRFLVERHFNIWAVSEGLMFDCVIPAHPERTFSPAGLPK